MVMDFWLRSKRFKAIEGQLEVRMWWKVTGQGHLCPSNLASLRSVLLPLTQLSVSQQFLSSPPSLLFFSPVSLRCSVTLSASKAKWASTRQRHFCTSSLLSSTFFKIPFIMAETTAELWLNQSGRPNPSARSLGAANLSTPCSNSASSHSQQQNMSFCIQKWKTAAPVFSGKTKQRNKQTQNEKQKKQKQKPGDQPNCLRHERRHDSSPYFLWLAKTRWQPSGF